MASCKLLLTEAAARSGLSWQMSELFLQHAHAYHIYMDINHPHKSWQIILTNSNYFNLPTVIYYPLHSLPAYQVHSVVHFSLCFGLRRVANAYQFESHFSHFNHSQFWSTTSHSFESTFCQNVFFFKLTQLG